MTTNYIAISSDLMFRSKIREASGSIPVQFVKSEEGLDTALELDGEKFVLVDLGCQSFDILKALPRILALPSVTRCLCYCSHVDEERMKSARLLGAKEVMPRSKFVSILSEIFVPSESRSPEKGAGKLTVLVFGSVIFSALYYAYHVIPFYYYFYELQNQMQAVIRVASTENDEVIRKQLTHVIKKLQIPISPEALKIERQNHLMRIELEYREVFYITFRGKDYTIQYFDFDALAEGEF